MSVARIEDARAEAERRYPWHAINHAQEESVLDQRAAFQEGARWAASRAVPSDECPECGDGPGCRCGIDWTAAVPSVTDNALATIDEQLVDALLVTYTPEGVATWLRQWLNNPDRRARMAHGVLAETPAAGRAETTTATTEDAALTIRYTTLDDGTVELDEVFADNATVHLEKMDTASWWLGIDVNGERLAVNLGVDEDGNEFAHAEPEMDKVDVELDGKPIASLYPPGLATSRPLATARTRPTEESDR